MDKKNTLETLITQKLGKGLHVTGTPILVSVRRQRNIPEQAAVVCIQM